MGQWYYLADGQEVGPIESVDLKRLASSGQLTPLDKVRRSDTPKWHRAKQIQGLFAVRSSPSPTETISTTPAIPRAMASGPPVNSFASSQPNSNNSFLRWYGERLGQKPILLQIFLWVVYGFVWIPAWWAIAAHRILALALIGLILGISVLGVLTQYELATTEHKDEAASVTGKARQTSDLSQQQEYFDDEAALWHDRASDYILRTKAAAPVISNKIIEFHRITAGIANDISLDNLIATISQRGLDTTTRELMRPHSIHTSSPQEEQQNVEDEFELIKDDLSFIKNRNGDVNDLTEYCYECRASSAPGTSSAKDNPVDRVIDILKLVQSKLSSVAPRIQQIKEGDLRQRYEQRLTHWKRRLEKANLSELENRWSTAISLYSEVHDWLIATDKEQDQALGEGQRPEAPQDTFFVGGITRLIEGDIYYLKGDNRAIRIPHQYKSLYIVQRGDSPNLAVVEGHFRFAGNVQGTNAFGGHAPIELYEVDVEYADTATRFEQLRREVAAQIHGELGEARRLPSLSSREGLLEALGALAGMELAEKTEKAILLQETAIDQAHALAQREIQEREEAERTVLTKAEAKQRQREEEERQVLAEVQRGEEQIDRHRYAASLFSNLSLDPKLVRVSQSARRKGAKVEFHDDDYWKIKKLQDDKNWLGLVNHLNQNTYSDFPDHHDIRSAADRLWSFKFVVLVTISKSNRNARDFNRILINRPFYR